MKKINRKYLFGDECSSKILDFAEQQEYFSDRKLEIRTYDDATCLPSLFLNEDIMKYLVRKLPNNYKDLYFKVEEIVDFSSSNKITLQNIKQLFKFF